MARFNRILLIILFFFSIVMIISGCSKKTYIYNQSDNTNNNFVEANASEKESVFDNIGEIPLMTFTSLEEYCSFFNEKNLENIILSDRQLDMLGTFEKMVVTSGGYNGDYSQLFYTIESSEQIYNLTITDTSIRKNH